MPNADHLQSESCGRPLVVEPENDVLPRIRDVSARCREPARYYLGVLIYPEDADGWVRVVVEDMLPTPDSSTGTLRRRPSSPPVGKPGPKLRQRVRVAMRDGDRLQSGSATAVWSSRPKTTSFRGFSTRALVAASPSTTTSGRSSTRRTPTGGCGLLLTACARARRPGSRV
jgi:hypothetical protein